MNIIERLQEWRNENARKQRAKERSRLQAIVAEMRVEKNNGRLRALLLGLPGVCRVTTESGGFKRAYCDAHFRSGHQFTGSGLWARDAIRNCTAKVVWHLRKKV